MTEVKIELPAKINGVYITNELIENLEFFQSSGTTGHAEPEFTNTEIKTYQDYLHDVKNYVLSLVSETNLNSDHLNELDLLVKLHWVHKALSSFAAPLDKII